VPVVSPADRGGRIWTPGVSPNAVGHPAAASGTVPGNKIEGGEVILIGDAREQMATLQADV